MTSNIKFTGKAKFDWRFDFVIPKSKIAPERILQVITNPTKETTQTIIFSWLDTKDVRPPDSQAYAILNDEDYKVGAKVTDALQNYDIIPVFWSRKEDMLQRLTS